MVEICMTIYNRPKHTIQGIKSLHKVVNNEVKVNFIDDCSTPINTGAIKETIIDCGMTNYDYIQNERNLGIERGVFFVPYVISTPYLYLTDNDMIYSSQFLEQLKKGIKFIGNNGNAAITFFDTKSHAIVYPYNMDYNLKNSIGGASLLIRTDMFFNSLKYALKNGFCDSSKTSWDHGMSKFFKECNAPLLSTKNSYVQHCGETGLHSRPEIPGSFDQADNFIE